MAGEMKPEDILAVLWLMLSSGGCVKVFMKECREGQVGEAVRWWTCLRESSTAR